MADGQNTTNLDLVRMNSGTVSVTNCYKTTSVGNYGTQCIFTTSAPSQLGNLVRDYGVVKAYENGLHYNGKYYLSPAASTNAGTESDPYIISSTYQWDSFAQWIKEKGDSFTGEYVQLIADITVSMPAGTSEAPFGGTFLGNGHTITANITDTNNQGTALFRYINGTTIKNLKVAGAITGDMHAAAIVGFAQGTGNSIRNCVATANVSGGTHIGGILGHGTTSDIAISGCVFSGTMTGGGTAKGALFGWGDNGGTKSVTDCLYVMADGQNTANLDLVRLNEGTVSVTNCYKTNNAGSNGKYTYAYTTAPANLGDLVQDYGMLKAYQNGILYDNVYYVAPASISLADDGYNSTTISEAHGLVADVTLQGRTLYKDGKWNTLCLPFALSAEQIAAHADFSGATLMELNTKGKNGFDTTDGTLYLTFKAATAIAAGVPYLVKWDAAGTDFTSPIFSGVTIDATASTTVSDADGDLQEVQMVGSYSPVPVVANDKSILFLGEANTLYYSTVDRDIRSFRAYFSVPYIKQNAGAKARAFRLDFGDGDGSAGVSPATVADGDVRAPRWHTLDGRRLSGKPTKSGVYVSNGRKIVVK